MLQLKIKTNIEMQTFNDGILSVYSYDENEMAVLKIPALRFENRIIGVTRIYAAAQAKEDFTDLVRIPRIEGISGYDIIVINNYEYEIKQIQFISDSNPPCIDLTLKKKGEFNG